LRPLLWSLLHCCFPGLPGLASIHWTIRGDAAQAGFKGRGQRKLQGELKKPRKTIPRCIFTALPLVTIIYLLVTISHLPVLTPQEILSSGEPFNHRKGNKQNLGGVRILLEKSGLDALIIRISRQSGEPKSYMMNIAGIITFNPLSKTKVRYYSYPHFIDEETGLEKLLLAQVRTAWSRAKIEI
uniref:solute carrier family 7 member 13 n=1 Tax=Halichoerus grypus TaxID=9711 RepID=UPI00165966FA